MQFLLASALVEQASAVSDACPDGKLVNGLLSDNPQLMQECRIVYQAWVSREAMPPGQYLSSLCAELPATESSLAGVIRKDFEERNTFPVNGLVLSRTEACVIACVGERMI